MKLDDDLVADPLASSMPSGNMEIKMLSLADSKPTPIRDAGFKRGYANGAQAMLDAIKTDLTGKQLGLAQAWIGDVKAWQTGSNSCTSEPPNFRGEQLDAAPADRRAPRT